MSKTPEEWIKIYEKKTETKFKPDKNFRLIFLPEKGFCEISADETKILVGATMGDGKFWKRFAEKIAREVNYKYCGTTCIRKEILAYIRLFGHKIFSIDENKNLKGYYTADKDGNCALLAECIFEDGKHGYKILWQVPKVVKENEI